VHLGQAAAQAGDGRGLLRDLARARGNRVGVLDGAAQVLLAYVAQGAVCVRADHHASIIGSSRANVVRRVDELWVVRTEDRLASGE